MRSGSFPKKKRAYKTVLELSLKENENLRNVDIVSFLTPYEGKLQSNEKSEIAEFFKGKSVLVTGGTGFLGKLIIEKLLRSCTDIKNIYLLVRNKKGELPHNRVDQLFDSKVFLLLNKSQPDFKNKIVIIEGDVSLPSLGINSSDRQILKKEIDVIVHVAATVRFDQKLREAVTINVGGTNEILKLASECKKLCSFVHVSTAYSNCVNQEIDEIVYEPPYTPDELLNIVETHDDLYLEKEKKNILGRYPNTYSFTKAVAEQIVEKYSNVIPCCIYRPSVVTSTHEEPLKGWVDNFYGPMGLTVGVGVGLIRTCQVDSSKIADLVPADLTVNGLIAACYNNQFNKNGKLKIYNFVSSPTNPITWGDFENLSIYYGLQNPSLQSVWYCCNTMISNYYLFIISTTFLHFLPSLIIDAGLLITGNKTRVTKMYQKIYEHNKSLSFFTTSEWIFKNTNTQNLWNNLSDVDKKIFTFDLSPEAFMWNDYLCKIGPGVRFYLLKDGMDTIPKAMERYKRLRLYHRILQGSFLLLLVVFIRFIFQYLF